MFKTLQSHVSLLSVQDQDLCIHELLYSPAGGILKRIQWHIGSLSKIPSAECILLVMIAAQRRSQHLVASVIKDSLKRASTENEAYQKRDLHVNGSCSIRWVQLTIERKCNGIACITQFFGKFNQPAYNSPTGNFIRITSQTAVVGKPGHLVRYLYIDAAGYAAGFIHYA